MSAAGFRVVAVYFGKDEMISKVIVEASACTANLLFGMGLGIAQPAIPDRPEVLFELTRKQASRLIRRCGQRSPVNDGYEHTTTVWGSLLLRIVDLMDEEVW